MIQIQIRDKTYCNFLFKPLKKHCFVFGSELLCHLCWLHMQQTVLAAQAVQMHSPKIAQLHKLCMLTFQKLAVAQALRVYIPKI